MVYINLKRIVLKILIKYIPSCDRTVSLNIYKDEDDRKRILEKLNPYQVPLERLISNLHIVDMENFSDIDFTNQLDVRAINRIMKMAKI